MDQPRSQLWSRFHRLNPVPMIAICRGRASAEFDPMIIEILDAGPELVAGPVDDDDSIAPRRLHRGKSAAARWRRPPRSAYLFVARCSWWRCSWRYQLGRHQGRTEG